MLLLLDNRDSFVFNLDQAFRGLGATTCVVRSDRIRAAEVLAMQPEGLVLSPGPGRPEEAGCLLELVRKAPKELPILGVCLGHQALAVDAGACLRRAPEVFHGRVSVVEHDGRGLFDGIPSPTEFCRYHSLIATGSSDDPAAAPHGFVRTAIEPRDGILMAMQHEELPRYGVQFHPESFRSPAGPELLSNFYDRVRDAQVATT